MVFVHVMAFMTAKLKLPLYLLAFLFFACAQQMSDVGVADVRATLNYTVDNGQRHHFVAYQPNAEERLAQGVPEDMFKGAVSGVDTIVHDGRGLNMTLDAHSFELVHQKTSLSTDDFYNHPEKITDVYYAEMAEMFKRVTGAAHVHVFHHQLRAARHNADGNGFNTSVQPYALGVHSDSSRHAAETAFLRFAGNAVDAQFCKGRFVYINAWRNITTDPIENNHLAVCDETSVVAPDDYVGSDLFMPGARLMQYGLSDHNAAKHRWYYFPKMQMEEVLLFKQFDSDTTLPGRMTFHTAFVDPTARPDAPERQSIECRAFLFFPDFEPNTCPALPSDAVAESVDPVEGDAEVEAAVQKTLGLIDTMSSWPGFARTWLMTTSAKKDGLREIAQTIVDDASNHHGFKKFSPEKKSMIVSLLMKSGWEVKLAARLKQMKSANKDVGQSSREAALRSLSLVVVGGLLGFVCARFRS